MRRFFSKVMKECAIIGFKSVHSSWGCFKTSAAFSA